jgi:tellurite resistance protein
MWEHGSDSNTNLDFPPHHAPNNYLRLERARDRPTVIIQPGQAMWPGLILGFVLVASAATGLFLCLPYWRSPQKRWRDRVFAVLAEASRLDAQERRRLAELEKERERRRRKLTDNAFQLLLSRIGVEQLESYPGIGSVSVTRLRGAGYRSVADLQNARIRVYGLGPKRLGDIQSAVNSIVRQAQAHFEAGDSPESQAASQQIRAVDVEFDQEKYKAGIHLRGVAILREQMRYPAEIARKISFWNFFWSDLQQLIPPQALEADLPSLKAAIQAANEQTRHSVAQPMNAPIKPAQVNRQSTHKPAVVANKRRESEGSPKYNVPVAQPVAPPVKTIPASPSIVHTSGQLVSQVPRGGGTEAQSSLRLPDIPGALKSAQHSADPLEQRKQILPENLARITGDPARANNPIELMELTVQIAFLVARCDGHMAQKEREIIGNHLRKRYGYDTALFNRAKGFAAHYESAAIDIDACLGQIAAVFSVPHREALLEFAYQIAKSSRGINKREQIFLEKIAKRLGVKPPAEAAPPPKPAPTLQPSNDATKPSFRPPTSPTPSEQATFTPTAKSVKAQVVTAQTSRSLPPVETGSKRAQTPQEQRAALEIDPTAPLSADLIRRQFRLLSERYSKEKLAGLGVEFVAMAERKRAAALAAANELIAQFGEKLEPATEIEPSSGLRDNPDLDAVFGV